MKVKRLHEMAQLEKAIVMMVWGDVQAMPNYDTWRTYERSFTYDDKRYKYKCKFRVEEGYLKLIDTNIEHEQIIVDLLH